MTRFRAFAVALTLAATLASCDLPGSDDSLSANEVNASDRVVVDGVGFKKPNDWLAVEPDDLAKGAESDAMDEVYEALNTNEDQFKEILGQFDVYLLDTIGATNGYADNISVVGTAGPVPDEGAMKAQYAMVGATDVVVETVDSPVGDVLTGRFKMDIGPLVANGESLVVESEDGMVVITVSAQKPKTLDKIVAGILDTLDEE